MGQGLGAQPNSLEGTPPPIDVGYGLKQLPLDQGVMCSDRWHPMKEVYMAEQVAHPLPKRFKLNPIHQMPGLNI